MPLEHELEQLTVSVAESFEKCGLEIICEDGLPVRVEYEGEQVMVEIKK